MKRLGAGCIVWVLVTACMMGVIVSARLIQTPRSELASIRSIDGREDIILIDVTRGINIVVARSDGDANFPAWSPDGQQLLFYSNRDRRTDLYSMNLNDGVVERLVASGGAGASPAWSPDGQWIAYATLHQPSAGLYLVRPDGSDSRRLTDFRAVSIVWSPDSQQIAFVGDCDSNCDIYVVTIGNGKVRQLTHNGLIDAYPTWSPDSRRLAFISNRANSFELYVMDVDCDETHEGGCLAERLTHNSVSDSFPAWSPDGQQIAFSSARSGNYEVYTVAADCFRDANGCDDRVTQITHRGGTNILPIWSPDGQQMAFLSTDHSRYFGVSVVNIDDQSVHLVQHMLPRDSIVAWRPNP